MNKYYITNNWDGKSYLVYTNKFRPNYFWTRYEKGKEFTFLGALWIKFVIFVLANDIKTKIEKIKRGRR